MMTSGDPAMADRLRLFAGHGMRPRYYHQVVGINSRLDTFQAAVLRVKLKQLPEAVESRGAIAARYQRMFEDDVDPDLVKRRVESAEIMNRQTGDRYEEQAAMRNTELLMMLILMESQVRR